MGADIHLWAEVKRSYPNPAVTRKEWKAVGKIFESEYYRKNEPTTMDSENYEWNEKLTSSPWSGRNYNLFAILADVRNGRGFAGCDTGDRFNPIVNPRGIPEDASDFYKNEATEYGDDGHSHSYVTLQELKDFDWQQTTKHRGWVDIENFKVFQEEGKPNSWSGGVSGGMVEHVSNQEMARRIEEGNFGSGSYYTLVEWEETYAESVGDFLTKTIPALEELLKMEMVHDVRLVYFFDN